MGLFISLQTRSLRIQGTINSYHLSRIKLVFTEAVLERGGTLKRHIEPALAISTLISMEEIAVAVNPLHLTIWSIGAGT